MLRLFGGSTGHGRGRSHQCPILGQGLGPLLALGGFNCLEFSGMFVAFIMCFGLVLGWGGQRVTTIHSLSLHVLSTSWPWTWGRSEGGRARATQGVNPRHRHHHHSACMALRFTEHTLIRELPGKQPLAFNSDSATE